ncbi:hypothetical protein BKA70DRAFT_1471154 [Coprinopsis sp. MPI-PUGE-AT-0042]|nr:hypothetical protein BKA70DRAFT_1471154 [Coprinopsis sp. MPI-PUGE-AT-0042]
MPQHLRQMHQSHNIPWHFFEEHTKFMPHQRQLPQAPPQLFSLGKPGEANRLNHFVRKFIATIEDISKTERKKYRPSSEYTFPTTGNIFSDELKAKYTNIINPYTQDIEYWIAMKATKGYWYRRPIADAVNMLLAENEMDTLFMLAHHPETPLHKFFMHGSWHGDENSFATVMGATLSSYLFFNIMSATGDLANGNWRRMDWYRSLRMWHPSARWDLPAEKITHEQFAPLWDAQRARGDDADLSDLHPDYQLLYDDLKRDIALMCKYDMFLRELGARSPWQEEITGIIGHRIGGIEVVWGENGEYLFC